MNFVIPFPKTSFQQTHIGLIDATKVSTRAPVSPKNTKRRETSLEVRFTVRYYKHKIVVNQDYSLSDFGRMFLTRKDFLPSRVLILPKPDFNEPRKHSNILSKTQSILDSLSKGGRFDIYQQLFEIVEGVAEDPDEEELIPESLESIAIFFLTTRLPLGSISSHEGTLTASWRLHHTLPPSDGWNNSDGFLFLRFLPSGEINCVMETRTINNHEGIYFASTIELNQALEETQPFFTRLNR